MDNGQDEMPDAGIGGSHSSHVPVGISREEIDAHQAIMEAARSGSARKPIRLGHIEEQIRAANSADELVGILGKYQRHGVDGRSALRGSAGRAVGSVCRVFAC